MAFVRIRVYKTNGEYISDYVIYGTEDNHIKALEKFKKHYPELSDWRTVRIAETIEEDIENPSEWFKAIIRCGCFI